METLYSRGLNFLNPFLSPAVNFDNQTLISVDTKFLSIIFSIQNYDKSVFAMLKSVKGLMESQLIKRHVICIKNQEKTFQSSAINKKFCGLKIADVKQTIESFLLALRLGPRIKCFKGL